MRTIFALFEGYREAKSAVEDLVTKGFDPREMNVVVQEMTARASADVNYRTVNIDKTDKVGQKTLRGIDGLIAGTQPTRIADVGAVYVAGTMAQVVAASARGEQSLAPGLKQALVDFNVPEEIAEFYRDGVLEDGVLFWMRTEDRRAAEAANILAESKGREVSGR